MPPPAWIIIGLLICFMEALWIGTVLDRRQNDTTSGINDNRCDNNHDHHQLLSGNNSSWLPRRSRPWPLQSNPCEMFHIQHRKQQQIIFVGLDQAEASIVGTIAMNLKNSCGDRNDNNYVITFVKDPLSIFLSEHQQATIANKTSTTKLVAFLRNPNDRAVADFFRWISLSRIQPTDKRFRSFVSDEPHLDHYYLRMLSWKHVTGNDTKGYASRNSIRAEILERYDFLGTTERLMESLVVLKMLWGLSWKDIMFLTSYPLFFLYSGGVGDDGGDKPANQSSSCVYQVPFFTNSERENLLRSARWKRRIVGDVELYGAANSRLDATIDWLGYDRVHVEVLKFQKLQSQAIDKCWKMTTFPCSDNGDLALFNHSCIFEDLGCGQKCLHELVNPD